MKQLRIVLQLPDNPDNRAYVTEAMERIRGIRLPINGGSKCVLKMEQVELRMMQGTVPIGDIDYVI